MSDPVIAAPRAVEPVRGMTGVSLTQRTQLEQMGRAPDRRTLITAVCVREWREALSNRLLVGMTLLPPVVILAAGIAAVAAAAVNPPSERDVQALYAAAPAVRGLDPREAVQGFIATYFLILFMLIPTVVPLTMAIYSVIGEKTARTLEPLLAAPVGVGELLFAKSLASTIPSVIVTWIAYAIYLLSVSSLGSKAAVTAVTAPRWILAIIVMVPLLTLLSVNLGILISTRVNDVRVAQQIGGLVVVPVVGFGIAQVLGQVVINNESFIRFAVVLIILDAAVFVFARVAFQRENILVRWR
jgi:ABC-2 type transport system permease protein